MTLWAVAAWLAFAISFFLSELVEAGGSLSFHTLIERTVLGNTFEVTVVGPAGSNDSVSLSIHPTSQGHGTLNGTAMADFDGGQPFSTATFTGMSVSNVGLYALLAKTKTEEAVSHYVQVVPLKQCNNLGWESAGSCGDCVSLTDFQCVYCGALQACLPGGFRGPDDRAACKDFYANVCFVRGEYALLLLPAAVCVVAFLSACYCVCACCRRRRSDERRLMDEYDERFSLARKREREAKAYGSTDNPARAPRTEEHRRRFGDKYNTGQA